MPNYFRIKICSQQVLGILSETLQVYFRVQFVGSAIVICPRCRRLDLRTLWSEMEPTTKKILGRFENIVKSTNFVVI